MPVKTLEEKQAELKAKNRKRLESKRIKAIRAAWKKKRKKGRFPGNAGNKFDFPRVLKEYEKEFNQIVDIVIATARSQTKQWSHDRRLVSLSKRILYTIPYFNATHIDREEIESELRYVWWMAYANCRKNGWTLRTNILRYSSYYLPQYIKSHLTAVYRTNTNEVSYELDPVEPFQIDLDYVINGSEVWPACLFDQQERYLIFLLQEYPGAYARIANMMQVSRRQIWKMVREVRDRISQECDYNASQNTTGLSGRGIALSA